MAPRKSLRRLFLSTSFRLLAVFAMLYAVASIMIIGWLAWNSSRLLEGRIRETILVETRGLAEQYRAGGIRQLARTINRRIRNPGNSIYLVTDSHGGWIAGNVRKLSRSLWNRQGRVQFAYERSTLDGKRQLRHAIARIYRLARGYRLLVGRDIEDQRLYVLHTRNAILSGLGLMLLTGLLSAWLVGRHLLGRIEEISRTSRMIMAEGDLSRRVPVDGSGDELDRLAVDFNAMLERIERLMASLREVSSNIAHDLKTPLNRMRSRLEAELRHISNRDGGNVDGGSGDGGRNDCRRVLEQTIEESDELMRTFNALLSIARLEAGSGGARFSSVNLEAIVRDAAELYEPLAEERQMQIRLELARGLRLEGDRQLLGQAIANLLDNAIKYGGREDESNGILIRADHWQADDGRLAADGRGGHLRVAVCDQGMGIRSEDRQRAMERFGRLEQSRNQPGTGLGLSLVAAIARLHGGELRLEDNHPGLCATLILPKSRG